MFSFIDMKIVDNNLQNMENACNFPISFNSKLYICTDYYKTN